MIKEAELKIDKPSEWYFLSVLQNAFLEKNVELGEQECFIKINDTQVDRYVVKRTISSALRNGRQTKNSKCVSR